jgi:poly(3-hydroxybutyrate) depolymerase
MTAAHRSLALSVMAVSFLGLATLAACTGGGGGGSPAPVGPGVSLVPGGGATPTPGASGTPGATPTPTAHPTPTAGASPVPSPTPTTSTLCFSSSPPTPGPVTPSAPPVRLGSYNIDPNKVFVAGISAGGFFAVDLHVAHSAAIKGAAIYAGGVYYCAQDSLGLALAECGGATSPNCQALYVSTLAQSESYLDAQSTAGTIDNESNLRGQPVYMWEGTNDVVVNPSEMVDLQSEYKHYGANVTFDNAFPANHGWESPDGTVPCGTATDPYMIVCNQGGSAYDSERTWLSLFFGALNPRNNGVLLGSLLNFDQTEFGASASNSLDTNGYLFVPASCAAQLRCGLVVAFHGCRQIQSAIQTAWIKQAGINEWADTNNFLVMYPYAVQSTVNPTNPQGCFDWWGYDNDPNYALKSGVQMGIIYKMVKRVDPFAPN